MSRIELPTERQVGHLTLLRQGRKISLKEYNALSEAEQLEMIRRASGKQKVDLILNAARSERLVAQLHPQELYLTVNELGAESAVEVMSLATPEQITTLLDLDCWDGDTLSNAICLQWLQLLLETGAEKVCQVAREIEPEILALFLKKHITIRRGLEAYDDDDAENANRLESLYDVEFASEDAAKTIGAFLRIIMEQAQESYLLLMEMVRSEIAATLEEEVFQGRNNRLGDLGIVPPLEARSIYSQLDPASFAPGGKSDFMLEADELPSPAALLAKADPHNLLAEVLTNSLSHDLATELCLLANRKMSADGTDIASANAIGSSLQELYDTLNLALEQLAGSDVTQAEKIVDSTYLLQLFQLGHSLVKQLQDQIRSIVKSPIGKLLDYPEQLFVDALLDKPAALYLPATEESPSQLLPISTLKELELVRQRTTQLVALQTLFCEKLPHLLTSTSDDEEPLPLSTLFLTAVANQLLGRDFAPTPLTVEDLLQLQQRTLAGGELSTEFCTDLQQQVAQLCENCGCFVDFYLECWLDDLTALDLDDMEATIPACLLIEG